MKQVVYLFLLAVLLIGCEGNSGKINHKIKYTTSDVSLKSGIAEPESFYTNLGDYITSITPRYFGAKMNIMMYQDHWDQKDHSMISYIDGHDNDPNYEISLYVDFSNNEEVSYTPILYGDLFNGLFRQKEILFKYFYFVPYYFEQEFEVPAGYGNNNIIGNNGTYTTEAGTGKRFIKITQQPLLEPVFGYPYQQPYGYFFGNTDSTFIVNRVLAELPASEDYPCGGSHCLVRSNHFTPVTVTMPDDGETFEMYSTVSFDTENLIQVYAGNDNLPYTADDWFTYAPNFWERVNVRLEIR
jgi:hypothetical protein